MVRKRGVAAPKAAAVEPEEEMETEDSPPRRQSPRKTPRVDSPLQREDSSASEGSVAVVRKRRRSAEADEEQPEEADASDDDDAQHLFGPDSDLLSLAVPPRAKPIMAPEGGGQRLMIHFLEVENFKSYLGKCVIGPMHHCFTSVIGPNGSGKSNVIDALLFVFAFKANRIRSKKLATLIHDSEGHKNLDFCSVAVHFHMITDLPDGSYAVTPGSEFAVSRIARRTNTSDYYIDGRKAGKDAVIAKLQDFGIDLKHNRFLILQGEVEQISQMKPKAPDAEEGKPATEDGMLEYLEDIIGSNRFQKPIEALDKRADDLTEKRISKVENMKRAKKNVTDLQDSYVNAVNFLKTQNTMARVDNLLKQIKRLRSKQHLEKATTRHAAVQLDFDSKNEALEKLKAAKAERRKALSRFEKALDDRKAEIQKYKDDFADLETRDKELKLEIDSSVQKINKMTKAIDKLEAEATKAASAPARLEKESAALRIQVEQLTENRVEAQAAYDAAAAQLDEATAPLQGRRAELEKKAEAVTPALNDARAEAALVGADLNNLRDRQTRAQAQVHAAEATVQATQLKLDSAQADLLKLQPDIPAMEKRIADAEAQKTHYEPEVARLNGELRTHRFRRDELNNQNQAAQGNNRVLATLMAAQNQGRLNGVIGRLGDLGGIDGRYDVAISTSAKALDNIVVETVECANAALEVIRRSGDRASFIVLDKMEQHRRNMERPARQCAFPRLFDLIHVAEGPLRDSLLLAFYFTIRDVVVADSKEDAVKLNASFSRGQGFDIVTLDGTEVKRNGAISGGGAQQHGKMGKKAASTTPATSERELRQLNEVVARLEGEMTTASDALNAANEAIRRTRPTLDEAKDNVRRLHATVDSSTKLVASQKKIVVTQQANLEKARPDPKEEDRLVKLLEEKTAVQAKHEAAEKKITDKIAEVEAEIAAVTDELIGMPKQQLEKMKAEQDGHEKTITSNTAKINGSEREIGKLKKKLESTKADKAETEEKWQALKEERRGLDDEAQRLIELSQEAEKAKEAAEKEFTDAREAQEKEGTETKDLEKEVSELKEDVRQAEHLVLNLKQKTKKIEKAIAALRLNDLVELLGEDEVGAQGGSDAHDNEPQLDREADEEDEEEEAAVDGQLARLNIDNDASLHQLLADGYTLKTTELHTYTDEFLSRFINSTEDDDAANVSSASQHDDEGEGRAQRRETNSLRARLHREELTLAAKLEGMSENIEVIGEYREKKRELNQKNAELAEITKRRDDHRRKAEDFRLQRTREFNDGFSTIAMRLKEMYQMITQGGDAELELVDSCDPFQGIIFSVRPPKKSWKQISNLSGGEKTLSSLALVFALHQFRPTPLYVMDEIDAALDYKNVSIVAHYIKDRTKNAQFVIISLRNQMFELANRLVGIYKTFDATKNVTVDPERIAAMGPGLLELKRRDDERRALKQQNV